MTWKGMAAMALGARETDPGSRMGHGGRARRLRLPASWAAEGLAMRRAIAADFACLPGGPVRVIVTSDSRLPDDPGPWTIDARTTTRPACESSALDRRFYRADRAGDERNSGEPDPRARSCGCTVARIDGRRGRAGGRQGVASPGGCK